MHQRIVFDNLNISNVKHMMSKNLIFWFDIIVHFGISTGGYCDSYRKWSKQKTSKTYQYIFLYNILCNFFV